MKSTYRKLLLIVIIFSCQVSEKPQPFKGTIESLSNYTCPEWFRDAKFGIYLHWGIYSVAEMGEWYGRQMYMQGLAIYKYPLKNYDHPSKFGYKDFIPDVEGEIGYHAGGWTNCLDTESGWTLFNHARTKAL